MSTLIESTHKTMSGSLPFVGHRLGDKLRFIVGVGINVTGAVVLLVETVFSF